MLRKMSFVIAAGLGALSFAGGAAAYGTDAGYPSSVNESGPVIVHQAKAPAEWVGATHDSMPMQEVGSAKYEVQSPNAGSERASG